MSTASELREKASVFQKKADQLNSLADQVEASLNEINGDAVVKTVRRRKSKKATDAVAKESSGRRGRPAGATSKGQTPLNQLIRDILAKYPEGTELKTIVQEIQDAGYKSDSKKLSQNVSTNLYLMRVKGKEVLHDKKTRKYSLKAA